MAIYTRRRKSGLRYQVKVKGSDGMWITATFDKKSDARAHEAMMVSQKHSGRPLVNLSKQITVSGYFESWSRETHTSRISEGWRITQIQMFRDYINPLMGKCRLSSISPAHILRVLNQAAEKGRGLQLQLHLYNVLHKMFKDAVEVFEVLPSNPVKKAFRPSLPHKESAYLEVEEVKKLLTHVRGKPYEATIWLGIMTGLRIGEIQALRWENVDLEQGFIRIRSTYARKEKTFRDYPKGRKWRSVRVPPQLWDMLKELRANSTSEFVVTSDDGNFLSYHIFRGVLKKYCREAGVRIIATHGLRHSASELYMQFGASRDDLRILFGHSSSKVTDRYVHDKGERLGRVADEIRMENHLKVSPNTPEFPQESSKCQIINFTKRRFK